MKTPQLPQTDSIQELAAFWDTHDLTDFEQGLEEVDEPVFEQVTDIHVHLQQDEAQAVHDIARSRGVVDAELIREWVRERIHRS